MTPEPKPCTETGSEVPFHKRHPDLAMYSWQSIVRKDLAPVTCVHKAEALSFFAFEIYRGTSPIIFAVDFDNGFLYNRTDVVVSVENPDGVIAVLSDQDLAELRQAIDHYQILERSFHALEEVTFGEDYLETEHSYLTVVFTDDTGSHTKGPPGYNPKIVRFQIFADDFLAKHMK